MGRQRNHAGADLVCGVSVGGHAIAPHKDRLYAALAHHGGTHVVADEGGGHPSGAELQGREPGTLEQGARLVAIDAYVHALLAGRVDGGGGGAVADGAQASGVAVGEDGVAVAYQRHTVGADGPAGRHVLVADGEGLAAKPGEKVGGACRHRRLPHAVHRPGEVDGGGPASGDGVADIPYRFPEGGVAWCGAPSWAGTVVGRMPGGNVHPDCGADSDGGCPAHLKPLDGADDGLRRGDLLDNQASGELRLIDERQRRHAVCLRKKHRVEGVEGGEGQLLGAYGFGHGGLSAWGGQGVAIE